MNELALLVAASLLAGTPLALAGLGLLVNERAGVLNLGAEGMMLVAGVSGFAVAFTTGSDTLAFVAGAAAGALLALAFGLLVIWLNTNQYATGLALSLFGYGFSAFVGLPYVGQKLSERRAFEVPGLAEVPLIGPALFKQHPMVYLTIVITAALIWFLYKSRAGLVLRAIGESPESAHALGYKVRLLRLGAVVFGGAGWALASWVMTGEQPMDLWVADIRRFSGLHTDDGFVRERTTEAYGKHYTIVWPQEEYTSAGPRIVSPLYERLKGHHAVFGSKLGWERPNWFARPQDEPRDIYSMGRQNWFEAVGEEHRAVREAAGLFDQSSFA